MKKENLFFKNVSHNDGNHSPSARNGFIHSVSSSLRGTKQSRETSARNAFIRSVSSSLRGTKQSRETSARNAFIRSEKNNQITKWQSEMTGYYAALRGAATILRATVFLLLLCLSTLLSAQAAVQPAGLGTQASPYQIATLANLRWLSDTTTLSSDTAVYCVQTADIDASATATWSPYGFKPIGMDFTTSMGLRWRFRGSYDGQGFTISNLYMNYDATSQYLEYAGLFYNIHYATLSNIHLVDVDISSDTSTYGSNRYVGGLVGYTESTGSISINNCTVSGSVRASSTNPATTGVYAGGLVGYLNSGVSLTNSSSSATVTATSNTGIAHAGGIAGYNRGGSINNCYSTNNVTAISDIEANAGGIAGSQYWYSNILNSYSSSTINSSCPTLAYAGGITGQIININNSITNCYSTGTVKADGSALSYLGGIVGHIGDNNNTISKSFSNALISRYGDGLLDQAHIGGIAGRAGQNITISECYSTSVLLGFCIPTNRGTSNIGGIAGTIVNSSSSIENCYFKGEIENFMGTARLGGIVGNLNGATIEKCYSIIVDIIDNSESEYIGAIAGSASSSAPINNSFWDLEFTQIDLAVGTPSTNYILTNTQGLPPILMKRSNTYATAGWDITTIWTFTDNENFGYPYLRNAPNMGVPTTKIPYNFSGGYNNVSITLNWDFSDLYNSYPLDSFNIYRDGEIIGTQNSSTFSYTDDNDIEPRTSYTYYITAVYEYAVGKFTESAYTNELGISTYTQPQRPSNYSDPDKGTSTNPYLISNLANLRWLSETSSDWYINSSTRVYFLQTDDIDAEETEDWHGGNGFRPIGHFLNPAEPQFFIGAYNGGGFTINNLYVNITGSGTATVGGGLFGDVSGSVIQDLTLQNVNINVYSYAGEVWVGGLAGRIQNNASVNNVSVSGVVNGESVNTLSYIGGIIGKLILYSSLDYSSSSAEVNSSSTNSDAFAGGLVGEFHNSLVQFCSSSGTITANGNSLTRAGGIAGTTHYSYIKNSIFTGELFGHGNSEVQLGGITAYIRGTASLDSEITDCQSDGNIISSANTDAYTGGIVGRVEYGKVINSYSTGDLSATGVNYAYTGGIAARLEDGQVTGSYSTGDLLASGGYYAYIGGIVARMENGQVTGSYSTGDLSTSGGLYVYIGGIVGRSLAPITINMCYSTGNISSSSTSEIYMGGILGRSISYDIIEYCYSSADLTVSSPGSVYLGGITGLMGNNSYIGNTFFSGILNCNGTGTNRVGGLAGIVVFDVTIINSYNRGSITASNPSASVGGLVGFMQINSTLQNCVFEENMSPILPAIGTNEGTNTGSISASIFDMKNINLPPFTNWDFDDIWEQDNQLNYGYPYLQMFNNWEETPAPVNLSVVLVGNSAVLEWEEWEDPSVGNASLRSENIPSVGNASLRSENIPSVGNASLRSVSGNTTPSPAERIHAFPTNFRIYRQNNPTEGWLLRYETPDPTLLTYTDYDLTTGETYKYLVTAVYSDNPGESAPSNIVELLVLDYEIQRPSNWGAPYAGTIDNPYLITNLKNLGWMSIANSEWWVDASTLVYFKQIADIDAADTATWSGGEGLIPIGYRTTPAATPHFLGVYDGGGFEIRNLVINVGGESTRSRSVGNASLRSVSGNPPPTDINYTTPSLTERIHAFPTDGDPTRADSSYPTYAGLFANLLLTSQIVNVHLTDLSLSAVSDSNTYDIYAGGIAGSASGVTIFNCSVSGDLSAVNPEVVVYLGGIAGAVSASTIENCYSSGSLTIDAGILYLGGIVGIANASDILGCFSTMEVAEAVALSSGQFGGIAGATGSSSLLSQSYFLGKSTYSLGSNITAGGIVGYLTTSEVDCVYSAGEINGGNPSQKGALVGFAMGSTINESYWDTETTGQVNGIGFNFNDASSLTNSYGLSSFELKTLRPAWDNITIWNDDRDKNFGYPHLREIPFVPTTNRPYSLAVMPSTTSIKISWTAPAEGSTAELLHYNLYRGDGTTYAVLDSLPSTTFTYSDTDLNSEDIYYYTITAVYQNPDGETAPRPWSPPMSLIDHDNQPPDNYGQDGAGTVSNPYQIGSLANLAWMSEYSDTWWIDNTTPVYFVQTADIDATETVNWFDGSGFKPIGYPVGGSDAFKGVYDGNGFIIDNLHFEIIETGSELIRAGLFGVVINGSELRNIRLTNINIHAEGIQDVYAGGLVGEIYGPATIDNCSVTGEIYARGNNYQSYVGGLSGKMTMVNVSESYTITDIMANSYNNAMAGGIVGIMDNFSFISNCYTMGSTFGNAFVTSSATAYVGGIVGVSNQSTVEYSYATGEVSVDDSVINAYLGGIAGRALWGSIAHNFWNKEVTGQVAAVGYNDSSDEDLNFGLTSVQMQDPILFIDNDWDFDDVWTQETGMNYGYPYLQSLPDVMETGGPVTLTASLGTGGVVLEWALDGARSTPYPPYPPLQRGGFVPAETLDGARSTVYPPYPPLQRGGLAPAETLDGARVTVYPPYPPLQRGGFVPAESIVNRQDEGASMDLLQTSPPYVRGGRGGRTLSSPQNDNQILHSVQNDHFVMLRNETSNKILHSVQNDKNGVRNDNGEITHFRIYRKNTPSDNWLLLTQTTENTYTDTTFQGDSPTYYYLVTAYYDPFGETPPSNSAEITIPSHFPQRPVNYATEDAGTITNPYLITTLSNLNWVSEKSSEWYVDGNTMIHFLQTEDIEASETITWNNGSGFKPIGHKVMPTSQIVFRGLYDGNHKVISNLYINIQEVESHDLFVGLFGRADGVSASSLKSSLKNINLENVWIRALSSSGNSTVGALVGGVNETEILNCSVTGEINNTSLSYYSYSGGLVGVSNNSEIIDSYAQISINNRGNNATAGGISGYLFGSSISNSYATFNIIGEADLSSAVGGLAGYVLNSNINNSYANGNLSNDAPTECVVGGIAGFIGVTSSIEYCYAAFSSADLRSADRSGDFQSPTRSADLRSAYRSGDFQSANGNRRLPLQIGGIAGYSEESSIITSLWDIELSGITESVGMNYNSPTIDTAGYPTFTMKDINTYLDHGWDFDDIWTLAPNKNFGYPYLQNLDNVPIANLPTNMSVTANTNSVSISWEAPDQGSSGDLNRFAVYRGDGTGYVAIYQSSDATTFTYLDEDIEYDTPYSYTVTAIYSDPHGESAPLPWSEEITFLDPSFERPSNYGDIAAGTESNAYLIANLGNLAWMSKKANEWWVDAETPIYFFQTEDIDATETSTWNDGSGFTPIGYKSGNSSLFVGEYNGNHKTISNLYINIEDEEETVEINIGLFAHVVGTNEPSLLKNIHLENISFTGAVSCDALAMGGLAGTMSYGKIMDCSATGQINLQNIGGYYSHAGGLVGHVKFYNHKHSQIIDSYSDVAIHNEGNVVTAGGLVGFVIEGEIIKSYATGDIYSDGDTSAYVGGLAGEVSASDINNSYFSGFITDNSEGERRIGGLVGYMGDVTTIVRSYSSGIIHGSATRTADIRSANHYNNSQSVYGNRRLPLRTMGSSTIGGLVGYSRYSYIVRCLWDTEISGITEGIGFDNSNTIIYTAGYTTFTMKDVNTYLDHDWEIDDIWLHDLNKNFGYPYLAVLPDVALTPAPENLSAVAGYEEVVLVWEMPGSRSNGVPPLNNSASVGNALMRSESSSLRGTKQSREASIGNTSLRSASGNTIARDAVTTLNGGDAVATHFNIYHRIPPSGTWILRHQTTDPTTLTYTDTGLNSGTEYEYAITAIYTSPNGESAPSDIITAETLVIYLPPSPAIEPTPAHESTNIPLSQNLIWSPDTTSPPPLGYKVYFGDELPLTLIEDNWEETSWSPSSLDYATMYYWQIIPFNDEGDAENCPVWSFTTIQPPEFDIYPLAHNFGSIIVGTISDSQTFTITNTGLSDLTISLLEIDGDADFNIDETDDLPWKIEPGEYKSFSVTFIPQEEGYLSANIFIVDNIVRQWIMENGELIMDNGGNASSALRGTKQSISESTVNYQLSTVNSPRTTHSILLEGTGIPPLPHPATDPDPENNATNVPLTQVLTWSPAETGGTPTGYKFYFQDSITDFPVGEPIHLDELYYEPSVISALQHATTYYWQVIPYNITGEAEDCPIWTFTTVPPDPVFNIDPESHDFGNIIVAEISDFQTFTITNTGGSPLKIENISFENESTNSVGNAFIRSASGNRSTDFEIIDLPTTPITLVPDESITFNVTFTPQTPGLKTAEIIISHNAEDSPFIVELSGTGLGLPVFSIDPESHDFGSIIVAEISDFQTFTITNTGGSPLIISEVSDCGTEEFITERINAFPTELAPDETVSFTVIFAPLTAGVKTDQITITHSASETPFIVNLSGIGIGLPIFTIDPEDHDFGNIIIGQSSDTRSFTITNTGGSPLTVAAISDCQNIVIARNEAIQNSRNIDFIIEDLPTDPITLDPDESMTFTVSFTPQTPGQKTEEIIITHSASETPFIVELSGTGLGLPVFTIDPEDHDFGNIVIGQSSETQTFTITNTGGSPLIISDVSDCETEEFIMERINAFPTELAPDESVTFSVTFTPLTAGSKTDQITITNSASETPFIVELSGTGLGLPVFTIDPEDHDFGNIVIGQSSETQTFTITNTGGSPLIITDVSDCETDEFVVERINAFPTELAHDESVTFSVTFAPLTAGVKSDQITITHSASDTPFIVELSGIGLGLPVFTIDPESHNFGNIVIGQSSDTQTFTITNTGGSPLTVATASQPLTDDFEMSLVGMPTIPAELAPDETVTFTVTFTPQTAGSKTDQITINHSASETPFIVELSGTGLGLPAFTIDPEDYDFGNIVIGQSSESQTFTITNTGGSPLTIATASQSLTDDFEISLAGMPTIPAELAPDETVTFTVTFTPQTAGSKTDQITITHSASETPFIVNLSGTGIGLPIFTIDPESHDFGTIIVAEISDSQTFTITNTGGSPLIISDVSDCETEEFIMERINAFPTELAPDETVSFTVIFAPLTTGVKTDQITITLSASETPFIVELSGIGLGLPVFTIDPESHDFGTIIVTEISDFQIFTITNTGGSLLTVATASQPLTDDFEMSLAGMPTLPTELEPDESVTFTVTFTPQTAGPKTDQITITHSASETPFIVELSGTGLGLPVFTIDPESHDFGNIVIGQSSETQTFTITNTGGSLLTVATASQPLTDDFEMSLAGMPTLPTELEPDESVSFTVTFTPLTAGSKTDQITITHSASEEPFILNVTGIAENPVFNPPQNLEAIAGDAQVSLSWESPEEQVIGTLIGYNIYKNGELIMENGEWETEYIDTDVINDIEYTYYVTAIYEAPDGESEPSNEVSATPQIVSNEDEPIVALKTELVGNYPNPFNPSTTIKFTLSVGSILRIDIYNVKGQKVKTLLDTHFTAGEYIVTWNGKDDFGKDVSSGVYFYRMQTGEYVVIKKMMMMK